MREKVWIVFRKATWMPMMFGEKAAFGRIEAITYTHEQAEKFASQLAEKIDPIFGIDLIEYEIDAERP